MPSLAEIIRFRASVDKLNDSEFNEFILHLTQKCGRDMLTTSLFTMFTHQFNTPCKAQDSKQQTLNTTLNIIKQIIESRKTKPKPESAYEITIQTLPSDLIGNLASYLNGTDYRAFSKANRTAYVGCNTPNTLQRLELAGIDDYSQVNLAKYPQLKHISIKLTAFDSFVLPARGETICNRLQRLLLNADKQTDVDITHFMAQNIINVNHINHLHCGSFGNPQTPFSFETFTQLVSKFPNIEYLSLHKVVLSPEARVQNRLIQLLPRLKGFAWTGNRSSAFLIEIITAFGSKLEALNFWDSMPQSFISFEFPVLQELTITYPQIMTLRHIFKSAKKLQKIRLHFYRPNEPFPTQTFMQKLLTTQPVLESIDIRCIEYAVFKDICNEIEYGLYNRKHKNKMMKLNVFLDKRKGDKVMGIKEYKHTLFMAAKMVHQLRALEVDNFRLMVGFKSGKKIDGIMKPYTDFVQKHLDLPIRSVVVAVKTYHVYGVLVTNAECSLNGLSETYRMNW